MKKTTKKKIVLLSIVGIIALIYLFVEPVRTEINTAVKVLTSMGIDGVIEYIRGYGSYAAVVSFLLMILQSIISPIPAFLITLSNAAIFGWVKGAILSWTSSMVGAVMCFYISRILGRDVAVKFTGREGLRQVDVFFEDYGKYAILVARLLPFISFDIVSYAAGLTSMSLPAFVIATGLGQLPATIVYSYVGGSLTGGAQKLMIALLLLFALSIVIYAGKKYMNDKQKKKEAVKEKTNIEK